jgi:hypothetical protein
MRGERYPMDDPNYLISHAFEKSVGGMYVVHALRKVAAIQQSGTHDALVKDAEEMVAGLLEFPDMRSVISMPPEESPVGGEEAFKDLLVKNNLILFRVGVDTASLILAHTTLDSVADLCCRASAAADPSAWLFTVREKTFSLRELEKSSPDQIQKRALAHQMTVLSRESLLKRINLLFKVCKPDSSTLNSGTYRFNRDRLDHLDKLRNMFVHDPSPATRIPFLHHIENWKAAADDLDFLTWTPFKLVDATRKRHSLRPSPEHLYPPGYLPFDLRGTRS